MPFSFPSNPTLNQTYTSNSVTWVYNGKGWTKTTTTGGGASTPNAVSDQTNTSTGYFDLPGGTTLQRPATPGTGNIRYNTTTGFAEVYTAAGDRKSTRLKSSHITTANAVFCLKKKQVNWNEQ